jgi:hypothetical protein
MTSTIKVDNIQNQCGANIINESSNTITIGASGDTVTLASGASQSGFGRSGTVDWQTGSIKTSTFTAVSGEGYFCNTTSSAFTVNLPAGSAGAIVAISDYTRTFNTNNLTISPNGSEKIGGVAQDAILTVNGQAITLVYVDGTEGWINVQNAEDTETGLVPSFITATGGTITTVCTNFKVHTFTSPGTFTVTCAGNIAGSNTVSYMVVAGGGGGGRGTPANAGGGGGAGGFREGKTSTCSYTASPLNAPAGLPVTAQGYPITVGGGGAGGTGPSTKGATGSNSNFSTITSAGGGGGGAQGGDGPALTGGSGGGHGGGSRGCGAAGNTPPVSPPQGQPGGKNDCFPGPDHNGAGGGGATVAGGGTNNPTPQAGDGGAGATTSINGTPTARAGGGGGGPGLNPGAAAGAGGTGGGGAGSTTCGVTGTANTGGGGGGSRDGGDGGVGGSGVVIIRYKFQ